MDWFWRKIGWEDPMKDVDPSLREFLKRETPRPTAPARPSQESSDNYRSKLANSQQSIPDESQKTAVPQQSLFQDGRYAHLWKTYRPSANGEQASDSEKLNDIVGAYQDRQASIGRAALENCADFQSALSDCFKNGNWSDKMTMCRSQNKSLERCITMQSKFLRALGYMTMFERTPAESERIQMHADKLYQQMLDQERQTQEAKEKGLPEPSFSPLIKSDELPTTTAGSIRFETLPKELQDKLARERFTGLQGDELELAKRQLEQEIDYNQAAIGRLKEFYTVQRKDRLERQATGQERISDKISRWFDFRDWSWVDNKTSDVNTSSKS